MYLGDKRYEEIKRIISEFFCDYEVDTLPIDVYKLCSLMNIILIPYSQCSDEKKISLLNASGDGMSCLDESRGGRFVIYYNDENCGAQRQRFTIMHEIGHIVLEHEESNDETESEANFFARNALAPLPVIIDSGITDLYDISSVFDISLECSGIVLRNLGIRLHYGHTELKDYEKDLLILFKK